MITNAWDTYQKDAVNNSLGWSSQSTLYQNAAYYYDGNVFDEEKAISGNQSATEKYPLRINKVRQVCLKHAMHLWGQYDGDDIVTFVVKPMRNTVNVAEERADEIRRLIMDVLYDNDAATMLGEQSRTFMSAGDIWFKLRVDPTKNTGIAIDTPPPEYVFPVWNPFNRSQLLRVYFRMNIDVNTAKQLFGYQPAGGSFGSEVVYMEAWDEDGYAVTINDQPAIIQSGTFQGMPLAGQTSLVDEITGNRMLPWVHVPRLRATGRFFGQSLALEITGLQDEYNNRKADMGEAVMHMSHPGAWGRNIERREDSGIMRIRPGRIMDLGESSPNGDPEIKAMPVPTFNDGTSEFVDGISEDIDDQSFLSPIMSGKDQGGAQRSGVTMAMKAIPTMGMIDDYRKAWNTGLRTIAHLVIAISYANKINGITEKHFGHRIATVFAPVLPKDREAIVTECTTLYGAGLRSRRRCLELLPDVNDVDKEMKEIDEDEKRKQEVKMAELKAKTAMQPKPFGGSTSPTASKPANGAKEKTA